MNMLNGQDGFEEPIGSPTIGQLLLQKAEHIVWFRGCIDLRDLIRPAEVAGLPSKSLRDATSSVLTHRLVERFRVEELERKNRGSLGAFAFGREALGGESILAFEQIRLLQEACESVFASTRFDRNGRAIENGQQPFVLAVGQLQETTSFVPPSLGEQERDAHRIE